MKGLVSVYFSAILTNCQSSGQVCDHNLVLVSCEDNSTRSALTVKHTHTTTMNLGEDAHSTDAGGGRFWELCHLNPCTLYVEFNRVNTDFHHIYKLKNKTLKFHLSVSIDILANISNIFIL